jgi:hypothetical protein
VRVVSDSPPAPPLGDDPLPAVPRGIEAEGVMAAPPLPDVVALGEDPALDPEPDPDPVVAGAVGAPEAYEERIAELADAASATGQTV